MYVPSAGYTTPEIYTLFDPDVFTCKIHDDDMANTVGNAFFNRFN